jgi:hypothetical protein
MKIEITDKMRDVASTHLNRNCVGLTSLGLDDTINALAPLIIAAHEAQKAAKGEGQT